MGKKTCYILTIARGKKSIVQSHFLKTPLHIWELIQSYAVGGGQTAVFQFTYLRLWVLLRFFTFTFTLFLFSTPFVLTFTFLQWHFYFLLLSSSSQFLLLYVLINDSLLISLTSFLKSPSTLYTLQCFFLTAQPLVQLIIKPYHSHHSCLYCLFCMNSCPVPSHI